jgi:hypothetical protein
MKLFKVSTLAALTASGVALLSPRTATADLFGFTQLTSNTGTNVASQFSVEVTDAGGDNVTFKFTNNVGIASSITAIYFDDGLFTAGSASVTQGAGTTFALGAPLTPGNLPGGECFESGLRCHSCIQC